VMGWVTRFLERASYRRADLVITPNGSYRAMALRRGSVDLSKVIVVRNGPETAERVALPPLGPPLIVAYAGAMNTQDGLEILFDAIARADAQRPGTIRLDMIGSGDDTRRLHEYADRLGVGSLVSWAGWLTGDAYLKRLHSAHVAVSPDPDDPFSRASTMIKVAEYIAGGLPCVIADIPESRVTAGDAAVYFRPGSAIDLARCLAELVDAPERLQELSGRALQRGPQLLWHHSATRLGAAYDWLFEHGPPLVGEQVVIA